MISPTGVPSPAPSSSLELADVPSGTLAELFLTAVENHGAHLAYRYFSDEGGDLEDVGVRNEAAPDEELRARGSELGPGAGEAGPRAVHRRGVFLSADVSQTA